MQTATIFHRPVSRPVDRRWTELERWTLEACLLRLEGREDEAREVLREKLPVMIREWSAQCGLTPEVIQVQLRRLFSDTQSFVARGLTQRRAAAAELLTQKRGFGDQTGSGPVGLRHTVALGDITGMLDGLAEAEREARREMIWPLRSPATRAVALV